MNLPKYKITIDEAYGDGEDLGISQIAFTATPAIKVKGMAFSSNEKRYFTDDVKMRIAAPALIPMEIYRCDEDGEYFAEFTEAEIERLTSKFMANLTNSGKFNLEHKEGDVAPAYILEAWIVNDPIADKAKSTFNIDVPKGTLMIVSQVTDLDYYNQLVANGQVGFSIEGFLGLKLSEQIEKHKNKYTMENKPTSLPEGTKFEVDGIKYIVKDGKVMTEALEEAVVADTTEAQMALPLDEIPAEEMPVEEMAVEPVVEPVAVVEPVVATPTAMPTEAEILAIIQPKLDEIYKMIADLKAEHAGMMMPEVEVELTKTKMSIHDRFSQVMKISKEN
jgi:Putative phage serine protease XkdF